MRVPLNDLTGSEKKTSLRDSEHVFCGTYVVGNAHLDKVDVSEYVCRGVCQALQKLVLEALQLHLVAVGSLKVSHGNPPGHI